MTEVLCDIKILLKVKEKFYKTYEANNGFECWTSNKNEDIKIKVVEMRMLR